MKNQRYHYFLFGGTASQEYGFASTFAEFLLWAQKSDSTDFDVFRYDNLRHQPKDLLSAADGWMGYQEISETEYLQLKEIINSFNQ